MPPLLIRKSRQKRKENERDRNFSDRLERSGYFDREWYLDQYPDVRAAGADPFRHFVEHGFREGREPNGLFDSTWYLERNRDVAEAGFSALEHYMLHGEREGRPPHPLFDPTWYEQHQIVGLRAHGLTPLQHYLNYGRYEGALSRSIFDGHPATRSMGPQEPIFHIPHISGPSIAVAVHVFYGDLADEICSYLKNIPYGFSAFFTVSSKEVENSIRISIEKYALNCNAKFHIAQNRGRNFGPFLVHFRKDILKHDIFLHIHSKKSLRTGDTQSHWRKSLYDGLLGSKALTSAIIGKFAHDAKVGAIYPSTHREFGPWFHSWLGSGHRGAELFKKLGIEEYHFRGSIDLPVGGMFWARTAALKSFLEYEWCYDEFDPEPSHHDGTLAHGIEHGICDIVRHHEFDYIEYDHYYGVFRRNWNEKLLHKYTDYKQFSEFMVDNADTVSFDFYDTLFCRLAFTPDDVHNYIGWVLKYRNLIPNENDFYRIRKAAEAHARTVMTRGDVDLDEIYASFSSCCDWSAKIVSEARELELTIEHRCLTPRNDVVELLKRARKGGKRTLLLSDSYMPKSFFEGVLKAHGLDSYFDELLISADIGYRKDRDDVWHVIQNGEAKDKAFVHLGDNEESDIHLPTVRGLPSLHILNTTALAEMRGILSDGSWRRAKTKWREGLALGPVIAYTCSNAFLTEKSFLPLKLSTPEDVGYCVMGPIYFGFFSWIANHAHAGKVKKLGFLAREGRFLLENYDYFRSLLGKDAKRLPPASYFHISRRLAIGAAQAEGLDVDAIMRGSPFRGTFSDLLLARVGFAVDPASGLADAVVSTASETDRAYLEKLLQIVETELVLEGKRKKSLLREYVKQHNLDGDGLAVVDLGYGGSIQCALQRIWESDIKGFYMVTSPDIINVFEGGGTAHGFFSEAGSRGDSAVKNYSLILESVLTADHGQVIDYRRSKSGDIEPIFKEGGLSQSEFAHLKRINVGAKQYMHDLVAAYGPEIAFTTLSPTACEMPLKALGERRLTPPDDFWSKLHVEDDFCGNDEISVSAIYGLKQ